MNKLSIQSLAATLLTASMLAACSDDVTSAVDAEPVTSYYNNMLASGGEANLSISYSGEALIGKAVRLTPADDATATLRLYGILPGDSCTILNGVAIQKTADGLTFAGTGTATNVATTFTYEGTTHDADGTMVLSLSQVHVPDNVLSQHGTFTLPRFNGQEGEDVEVTYNGQADFAQLLKSPIYSRFETKGSADDNLIVMAWNMALQTVANNLITSVLDDVTFATDGNVTAHYKSLNDTIGFQQLMTVEGLQHPDKSEFAPSPANLAMYYFTDAQTMYVVPNVDQIMQQVEADKAKKAKAVQPKEVLNLTTNKLAQVAHVLTTISTHGLRLTVKENPYSKPGYYNGKDYLSLNEGDYVAYADLNDVADVMQLFDVLRTLLPEETLQKDVFELLTEKGVALPDELQDYMPTIQALLPDTSVGGIIDALESNLSDFRTMEIGFYLNK